MTETQKNENEVMKQVSRGFLKKALQYNSQTDRIDSSLVPSMIILTLGT